MMRMSTAAAIGSGEIVGCKQGEEMGGKDQSYHGGGRRVGHPVTAWCLCSEMAAELDLAIASALKIGAPTPCWERAHAYILGVEQGLRETASTRQSIMSINAWMKLCQHGRNGWRSAPLQPLQLAPLLQIIGSESHYAMLSLCLGD
jgi:hypothetical protein